MINNMYESLGHMIDGEFVGVLAKSYELSEDEKTLVIVKGDAVSGAALL